MDEDPNQPILRKQKGAYRLQDPKQETISMHPLNRNRYEQYKAEEWAKLFPEYRPKTDTVTLSRSVPINGNKCPFLLLNRHQPQDEPDIPAPGFYRFVRRNGSIVIDPISMMSAQDHVECSRGISRIEEDIRTFAQSQPIYEELGTHYRRGALVYGPPGNGKTYSILRAARRAIRNHNARVFLLTQNSPSLSNLMGFRSFFEDILTIFVIEEVTEFSGRRGASLLRFLDGEWSWSSSYSVGTTNYPGKLPGNIVDRPGRFDLLVPMYEPKEPDIRRFIKHFLPEANPDKELVRALKGFSIAYIKEMALRSRMYDQSLASIVEEFEEKKSRIEEAFKDVRQDVGFVKNNGEFVQEDGS